MARPLKEGLDYFPLDVDIDQDDKFQLVEALHGVKGFGITVKLLMRIYKEGFYYDWTEREQLLFSKRVNENINDVKEVVNDCIKYGVFDSETYATHEVLTSRGIQKRYFEAVTRRKTLTVKESLLLIDINDYQNINRKIVNVDINPKSVVVDADISTQSKVKESKGEKSKVNHKQVYDADSPYFILAEFLYKEIQRNNPNHKEPNFQNWADEFRKIIELDDRDKKEVSKIIRWVQSDDFEMVNVQSPNKIRKRYDNLVMKMNKAGGGFQAAYVPTEQPKDTVIDINAGEDW